MKTSLLKIVVYVAMLVVLGLTIGCKEQAPVFQVNDVISDPGAFSNRIIIEGVVYSFSKGDTSIVGVMDKKELQCTSPNCNKNLFAIKSNGVKLEVGDEEREIPCDAVLVFYGLAPKLGPIAEWGLDINRKTINVDTEKFETSTPGIYAVGDINFYPGKKKLILSGFHEAALAAFAAKERIEPEKKVRLQYTTTSPLMHERLGIADEQVDD